MVVARLETSVNTFPGSWSERGKCRGENVDLFYSNDRSVQRKVIEAYCSGCGVRSFCLDYALSLPPHLDKGIWGGTTERRRRGLRRETR